MGQNLLRGAVDAARDHPNLAIAEDPEVEFAAPRFQDGIPRQPIDLRKRRLECLAVHRHPAMARPRTFHILQAAILGGGSVRLRQGTGQGRRVDELIVHVGRGDGLPGSAG